MRTIVIINEQHSLNLLPQRKEVIIRKLGDEIEIKKIPSEINRQQIEELVEELSNLDTVNIVVLSPTPLLLGRLAHKAGEIDGRSHIYIFHNDKREKVELNGTVRSVIANEGWDLIEI